MLAMHSFLFVFAQTYSFMAFSHTTLRCCRDCPLDQDTIKPVCDWDQGTALIRYYEIYVKATDFAGNVGDTQAYVIVLPENYQSDTVFTGQNGFGTSTFFVDMVDGPPEHVIEMIEVPY